MAANESTRLLPLPLVEGVSPPVHKLGFVGRVLCIPALALRWHGCAICFSLVSALACWGSGYAEFQVIDPLIFKSIFVVFGFALGFRNVQANRRHSEALANCQQLFSAAWSIIALFPNETRPTVREALFELLNAIADHVSLVADRTNYWYGIVGLQPVATSAKHSCSDFVEAALAPRTLMVAIFLMCEDTIGRIETGPGQGLKRSFWLFKDSFASAYGSIEALALPSVTDRYCLLVNLCCAVFGIALPWGISSKAFLMDTGGYGRWHLNAGAFLFVNTMVCTCVLFGLNALAQEMEDPFDSISNNSEINLHEFAATFRTAVKGYEKRLSAVEIVKALGSQKAGTELAVEQHALVCGSAGAGASDVVSGTGPIKEG